MKRNKLVSCFVALSLFLFCVACNFGGSSTDVETIKENWSNAFNIEEGGALENVTILFDGTAYWPENDYYLGTVQKSQVLAGGLKKSRDMYYATIGTESAYAQKQVSEDGKIDYRYAVKSYYGNGNDWYVWDEIPLDIKEYVDTFINLFENELTDLRNNPLSSTDSDGSFSFKWTFNDEKITYDGVDYTVSLDTKVYFTSQSDKIDRIQLDGVVNGEHRDGKVDEYAVNLTLYFKNYGRTNLYTDYIMDKVSADEVKRIVVANENRATGNNVTVQYGQYANVRFNCFFYDEQGNRVISKTPANVYVNDVYYGDVYDNGDINLSIGSANTIFRAGENKIKFMVGDTEEEITLNVIFSYPNWSYGEYFSLDLPENITFTLRDNGVVWNGVALSWDEEKVVDDNRYRAVVTSADYYNFRFRVIIKDNNGVVYTVIAETNISRDGNGNLSIKTSTGENFYGQIYRY